MTRPIPVLAMQPLPLHTRVGFMETPQSYLIRLAAAHHLAPGTAAVVAGQKCNGATSGIEEAGEFYGQLPSGTFRRFTERRRSCDVDPSCRRCLVGFDDRVACRLCRHGETIQQIPHLGPSVCAKHRVWIGPGTAPAQQIPVNEATVRADRHWQRMLRDGALRGVHAAELLSAAHRWAEHAPEPPDEAGLFTRLSDLWWRLTRPLRWEAVTNPGTNYPTLYRRIESEVRGQFGDAAIITDTIWLILRPVNLRRREILGEPNEFVPDSHDLPLPRVDGVIVRPLPPFAHYLDQLRTCRSDKWRDVQTTYLHRSPRSGITADQPPGGHHVIDVICPTGHRSRLTATNFRRQRDRDQPVLCTVCTGRHIVPGLNSLRDLRPDIAAHWHPSRNGGDTPDDTSAGSNSDRWWICVRGHVFHATVANFVRTGPDSCPLCSRRRAEPGVNGIDITHPALARMFHPTKNGDTTPSEILAGSDKALWWICPHGHDYQAKPWSIAARLGGCDTCRRQKVQDWSAGLAVTHPDVIRSFHPTRNGDADPAQLTAGMARKFWWICPQGHTYSAAVNDRLRHGGGCGICHNSIALPGYNTLADLRPDLAKEWHPDQNGDLTPSDVVSGSTREVWWLCPQGHPYPKALAHRVRGYNCPYCTHQLVWPGFNDAATRFPDLMADWDQDANGDFDPTHMLAGRRAYAWKCKAGHKRVATFANRRNAGGCVDCSLDQRVGRDNRPVRHYPPRPGRRKPPRT